MREKLKRIFAKTRNKVILDAGCGKRPIDIFDESNFIISFDKDSRSRLEEIAIQHPNNTFIYGNLNLLPIKENSVDIVYAGFVPNFEILAVDYALRDLGYLIIDPCYNFDMLVPGDYAICYVLQQKNKNLKFLGLDTIVLQKIKT